MGRRGPARTPDAVKLARGETRPSRLNGLEPLPRQGRMPAMPGDMDDEAKKAWREVMRDLRGAGVLTGADAFVLRLFCDAWSRYVGSVRLLASMRSPLINDRGYLAKNPLHQVVRDNMDAAIRLARELGLSPAARANLQVSPGASVSDIDAELGPPPRLRAVGGGDG